ncbi:MAG: hypothetical protein J4400_05035 [Candidatus Aenigmarchaeota archaeon]|nr:hypothetical protein [Candidatus Aenigmarchaeota archaeon]
MADINPFVWFVLTLLVALSNIIFSVVVYTYLSLHKKLHKDLKVLKEIALLYAVGMTIALAGALGLLALVIG